MKVNQDYVGTSLGVAEAAVTVTVADSDRIAFDVTGTFVGTITFEASVDGTTFLTLAGATPAASGISTLTAPGVFVSPINGCHGFEKIRARMSAYTSGTALVKYQTARSSK